jgi:AraC family transcriptional regulator of adaptative response/methylated-DNA-[protein]-cysteine methyltransferase
MTDQEKWDAVVRADADAAFFYAVESTGVFCRPSCRSRKPSPENVRYFDRAEEAVSAGFRPCKRCRPDLREYLPDREVTERAKAAIRENLADKRQASEALSRLGLTRHRLDQVFRAREGVSPAEYLNRLRLEEAARALTETSRSTLDIAQSLGFESPSAFASFFKNRIGTSPSAFRKGEIPLPEASRETVSTFETALGPVTVQEEGGAVLSLRFGRAQDNCEDCKTARESSVLSELKKQLEEYFSGGRTRFNLPVSPRGTPFQRRVWAALLNIPYGETRTYAQIAEAVEKPKASRAVGAACRENPVLVLIPCHRVVGSDGALRGYAGGLDRKGQLLKLEQAARVPAERHEKETDAWLPSSTPAAR